MSSKFSFVHPSKLWPDFMPRESRPPVPIPSKYRFTVHIRYGGKFNPVVTLPLYVTTDYDDAFAYLEDKLTLMPNTKKRLVFVKQIGSRRKHTYYDPVFAEAIKQGDIDSDEYYEEPTSDDKVYVQLKDGKPTWRGTRQRQDAWMDREWDDLTIST